MDIVVIGAGEVGSHLADILSREGHRVSVVDSRQEKSKRLMESMDVHALTGDGSHAEILNSAGASKADLVVAVTNDDKVNMLACLTAKRLGARRVILRLRDTKRIAGYRYFYKRSLGFDVVLSTQELAAEEISATVREQHALEVESFADGRVQLRRLRIRQESELTSETLEDLRLPGGLLVAAILRKDAFFVPDGKAQLAVEDQIYVIGRAPDLDEFELLSGARKLGRRSVVIMGGGGVGREIARKLEGAPGVAIRVLEQDPRVARDMAAEFGAGVMVLVGDGSDLDLLLEERIGDANVFIATTRDDENNMVACQLARSLGVERTVAVINKASYRRIYDLLGVDQAISPRVLCANRILRFVRSSSVSSIAVVADGRGEVLELEVGRRKGKGSRKVKNLGLPRATVIGALVRGDEVLIPEGDTVVEAGDQAIVFTLPENLGDVEAVLGREKARKGG